MTTGRAVRQAVRQLLTAHCCMCTLPTHAGQTDRRALRAASVASGRTAVTALRIFLSRLIGWLGGNKRDADLRAEIDAHIDEPAEELERQGVPVDEARRLAFAQFGGVTQTMEAHRNQRRFRPFGSFGRDLAYSVRMLVRNPGFTLAAVLTLAIGILGNTTIFSGVNALLFTPLSAERPEQIAQIVPAGHPGGKHPLKLYAMLRDNNSSFVALAAIRDVTVSTSDTAQAARSGQYTGVVRGEVVSGNYFEMLGVRVAQGRVITPDDDRTPNAHPVGVSDGLWRTRSTADPQALARLTYLNGKPFTIIGILPPSFTGTVFANETD